MPTFLNSAGLSSGSSMTSLISCSCSSSPPTFFQEIFGFSMMMNFSASNFLICGILRTIVRFFCSARTWSPDSSFCPCAFSTRNSFPLGSLMSAFCPMMLLTSQAIRGGLLNFSSFFRRASISRSRFSMLSRSNLFSSSRPSTCVEYPYATSLSIALFSW